MMNTYSNYIIPNISQYISVAISVSDLSHSVSPSPARGGPVPLESDLPRGQKPLQWHAPETGYAVARHFPRASAPPAR